MGIYLLWLRCQRSLFTMIRVRGLDFTDDRNLCWQNLCLGNPVRFVVIVHFLEWSHYNGMTRRPCIHTGTGKYRVSLISRTDIIEYWHQSITTYPIYTHQTSMFRALTIIFHSGSGPLNAGIMEFRCSFYNLFNSL